MTPPDKPDVMVCLRSIYPNLMGLEYDNARTRNGGQIIEVFAKIEREKNRQALHQALRVLNQLSESRRRVGIISHVAELKEQIPADRCRESACGRQQGDHSRLTAYRPCKSVRKLACRWSPSRFNYEFFINTTAVVLTAK